MSDQQCVPEFFDHTELLLDKFIGNHKYSNSIALNVEEGQTTMLVSHEATISAIFGLAIGVAAVQTLHAQGKPPAYVVTTFQKITDPNGMKTVMERSAPAIIAAAGGRYIIRSNDITGVQGTPPTRFVVIKFDNVEAAQAWTSSETHKETMAIRARSSESSSFMVEGMTE